MSVWLGHDRTHGFTELPLESARSVHASCELSRVAPPCFGRAGARRLRSLRSAFMAGGYRGTPHSATPPVTPKPQATAAVRNEPSQLPIERRNSEIPAVLAGLAETQTMERQAGRLLGSRRRDSAPPEFSGSSLSGQEPGRIRRAAIRVSLKALRRECILRAPSLPMQSGAMRGRLQDARTEQALSSGSSAEARILATQGRSVSSAEARIRLSSSRPVCVIHVV